MHMSSEAENQITLMNGISVNVYINKVNDRYVVWFEVSYPREEFEEFGMGYDWDDAEEFCGNTRENPWISQSLSEINRRLNEINKYRNGAGFMLEHGELIAKNAQMGA